MRTLADLEALADHIGKLETAGDQLRAAVKQLLVARSDSSVRLASVPRGIFSRRLVGSDG
jgi:hypothetical protein